MDLEKEVRRLKAEVDALKVAFSQSGTNVHFVDVEATASPDGDYYILSFDTIEGGPTIAFSQLGQRLPYSKGARWRNWFDFSTLIKSMKGAK